MVLIDVVEEDRIKSLPQLNLFVAGTVKRVPTPNRDGRMERSTS